MRVLLLVHGFNSLSQRLFVELREDGHEVSVEFDVSDAMTRQAVELFRPDVLIAPYLKRAIPEDVFTRLPCLVVHPGIPGDRGPSALDWAILEREKEWGVTVLQAEAEMDAGPVWAYRRFPMRAATKSSIYRNEVADGAVEAVREALAKFSRGERPVPADTLPPPLGRARPLMRQADRRIDWSRDDTATVLRKIACADGMPGVKDEIAGRTVFLHDARAATGLSGEPGALLARSGPAICRATTDGAVWIGHLRVPDAENPFKLPATMALADVAAELPEIPVDGARGYREISLRRQGDVVFIRFEFHNGAMSTGQCARLLAAYGEAQGMGAPVIVLEGGADFWSNGMHLNMIEAAPSPADESWRNINAIDDLAEAVLRDVDHVTIAAVGGNAGAGGVFLARACDHVWLRESVVLNPHYKDMGNLYGSEFWTYLLPRHVGGEQARAIPRKRLPMGAREAVRLGLADALIRGDRARFAREAQRRAAALAADGRALKAFLEEKRRRRARDEAQKPLADYRREELEHMRRNFYGFDPSYHVARYNFVFKVPKSRTPITLARHRDRSPARAAAEADATG